jgi:peptidoglycan/xylan/chitin deacetylase (PgdA/CDA1 family)
VATRRLAGLALALAVSLAGCSGGRAAFERSPFHSGAGNAILRVRTSCPVVALTFDDGPLPGPTDRVLRSLAAAGARATFFDVGLNARARPDLVVREVAAGDDVGDHTEDHLRLPPLSGVALAAEFSAARSALRAAGAPPPHLFRPPHGDFDGRIQAAALARGERLIGWDLVLEPRRPGRSAAAVAARARPGSIILAHDAEAAAIPGLLRDLRRRGLRSVAVSTLLRLGRGGCAAATTAPQLPAG